MPESPIAKMIAGHYAMMLCCLFYLAWWSVAFHPHSTGAYRGWQLVLLLAVLGSAFLGILLITYGIRAIPETPVISTLAVCSFGMLSYFVLLFVTSQVFQRISTAELFLIVTWAVLEFSVINSLYGTNFLPHGDIAVCTIILAATIIGLMSYMMYYSLDEMPAYYCGMVPLLVDAAAMWLIVRKISSVSKDGFQWIVFFMSRRRAP